MTASNDLEQALDALRDQARRRQELLEQLGDLQTRAARLQAQAGVVQPPSAPTRSKPLWLTVLALQVSTVGLLFFLSSPAPEVSETLVALGDDEAEPVVDAPEAPAAPAMPAEPKATEVAVEPVQGDAPDAQPDPAAQPEAVAEVANVHTQAPAEEPQAAPQTAKPVVPRSKGVRPDAFQTVASFPYQHQGNTRIDGERLFDRYGCAPSVAEEGPEHWFKVEVAQAGRLVASIPETIDDGVDIDLHLLSSSDTGDCLSRAHRRLDHPVEAGTYWLVLDSYSGSGMELPGSYDLTVRLLAD